MNRAKTSIVAACAIGLAAGAVAFAQTPEEKERIERFEKLEATEKAELLEKLELLRKLEALEKLEKLEKEKQAADPVPPEPPAAPADGTGIQTETIEKKIERKMRRRNGRERIAMGSSTTVKAGEIVDSVVAFGGTVTVEEGAMVENDAVAFGGTVTLREGSTVQGDVVAFGGSVIVKSGATVLGDTVSFGGAIEVEEGATIRGDTVGRGGVPVPSAPGSDHDGPRARHVDHGGGFGDWLGLVLFLTGAFLAVFLIGWAVLALLPRPMDRMRRPLAATPGRAFGAGLLTLLGFVPALVLAGLLSAVIIGIPLIFALLFLYPVALWLGWIVVAMAVGRRVPTKLRKTPVIDLAVGLALLWAVSVFSTIPYVGALGVLILVGLSVAGIGSVVMGRFGLPPRQTSGTVSPPPPEPREEAAP